MHARALTPQTLRLCLAALVALAVTWMASFASAQSAGFAQALAQAAAKDKTLAAYYKATGYQPLWVGKGNKPKSRVKALQQALKGTGTHALPAARYDLGALQQMAKSARTAQAQAQMEVAYSQAFLAYARDVQTGILVPQRVVNGIERDAPRRNPTQLLTAFSKSSAKGFLNSLPPKSAAYAALLKEKTRLEKAAGKGWGPKVGATLSKGDVNNQVAALRARLNAMGYLKARGGNAYDDAVLQAVARFQRDHGMTPDGVVGKGTLAEINKTPVDRLASVVVAMERERWMNFPLGKRHVWVNLPDFTAKIVDNGKTTFETRSVVGKNVSDRRSPEFSDVMEFMVINPTWNVPRSITVKEYLPMLQSNRNSVGHLQLVDSSGRVVSRGSVNFNAYNASTFPYRLKEPPSSGNALGTVKFMFPNQYNIYLHDTPSKSLFARETRAFSHGCIRLGDPHDFAYALLKKQTGDPVGFFQSRLKTGRETTVQLKTSVPVHIVYFTAYPEPGKAMQYRRDVYGRDGAVFKALRNAGVTLRAAAG